MEIEEAFTAYLKTKAGLTALITHQVPKQGGGTVSEICLYSDEIPKGKPLPAVSYIKISDLKDHTLTGQVTLERPMFQFTAFALTKVAARNVANQLKAALMDYAGTMGGITIQWIRLENELSNLETSPDGTIKIYTESLEYQINYIRS